MYPLPVMVQLLVYWYSSLAELHIEKVSWNFWGSLNCVFLAWCHQQSDTVGERFPIFRETVLPFSSGLDNPTEDCWLLKIKSLRAFEISRTIHPTTECHRQENLNRQESVKCNEQSQVRWCVFGCGFCWQGSESGGVADNYHQAPVNIQQQQQCPGFFDRLRLHRRRTEPHQVKNSRL